MIEKLFKLLSEFKSVKKRDDIATTEGDRVMIGLFAVAGAIEHLACVIAEFKPLVAEVVAEITNYAEVSGDGVESFEIGPEDLERVKELLSKHPLVDKSEEREAVECDECIAPDDGCRTCVGGSNFRVDVEADSGADEPDGSGCR